MSSTSSDLVLSLEGARRIASLAPWCMALALLYVTVAGVVCFLFAWDFGRSADEQGQRLPYLIVFYSSLILLFALSAYRSIQSAILLRRLARNSTGETLALALARIRDVLVIFFVWVTLLLGGLLWLNFVPAY